MLTGSQARLALFVSLAFLAPAAAAQTTWHVDVNATAPGNGTLASPYTSIEHALEQATTVAGDTLLVAPGTYVEHFDIVKAVRVRSAAGPLETRILPAPDSTSYVVSVSEPGAVLEGFTVNGSATAETGCISVSDFGKVERCIATGAVFSFGIVVWEGIVDHCTVTGNRYGIEGPWHGLGQIQMSNTIVWGNTQKDMFTGLHYGTVAYSAGLDLNPYWYAYGPGNLPYNAGLSFAATGDPSLLASSICIDAGSPNSQPDPDGSEADIGALAFNRAHVPGPQVYCTGKLHSQGCVTSIGWQGQASLSNAQPFLVTASLAPPQKPGLLFYGFGAHALPLLGGTHCVLPPTPRTLVQLSGGSDPCSGTFSFDFNAWMAQNPSTHFVPGGAVFAQYWFRDPADPAGFGVGFSNALEFLIAP
jgi:hypothetical protein